MPTPSTTGRFPGATWRGTPNFWEGHRARRAVCIHINQGSFEESIAWMAKNGTSAHFEVGRAGQVAQLVDTDDSAWGNGLSYEVMSAKWLCPHGHVVKPAWKLLEAPHNPNLDTISIEHEGFSGKPWTLSQRRATVGLLVWLGRKYPDLVPYVVGSTLIGHYHLDPIDRAGCPGTTAQLDLLASEANQILGADEPWVHAWQARGVMLPRDRQGWAIPQLYKFHFAELGACVHAEEYLADGQFSLAIFERGFIYYLAATGRAYLGDRFLVTLTR